MTFGLYATRLRNDREGSKTNQMRARNDRDHWEPSSDSYLFFAQTDPLLCTHHPSYPPPIPIQTHRSMEGAENAETSEKESPLLQIDPKWYV